MISAFENGATILQRIKKRRAAKQLAPLPELLESSVVQAPEEIEREKLRGIVRFGRDFEVGDLTAIVALQQVTIQLQNSLLNKIGDAEDGDADIAALARAADLGRDSTITTLIALRQRLVKSEMSRTVSATATMSIHSPVTPVLPLNVSSNFPRVPPKRSPPAVPMPQYQIPHYQGPQYPPPPVPPKSYSRSAYPSTLSPVSPAAEAPRFSYGEVEDDRSEVQSTASSGRESQVRSDSVFSVQSQRTSSPATSVSTRMSAVRTSSSEISPNANSYPLNFSTTSAYPSRSNNYLGFCKTAWKLQGGDEKAMIKAKDFSQSAQSRYHFLTCSKFRCEFKGRGPNALTNKAIVDTNRGLKYRWSFLAKSHVFLKTVHDEQYSYLCVFCVFSNAEHAVVMNLAALLDHINREHRGGRLSDVILDRTHCIDKRVAKDSEKFDINLFPLEEGRSVGYRDSTVGPAFMETPEQMFAPMELSTRKQSTAVEKLVELHG